MTMSQTDEMKADLVATSPDSPATLAAALTSQAIQDQLGKALPSTLNRDRFTRVLLTSLRQNPGLASCTRDSFLGAVFLSAQLGLEPGPFGHVYLIPQNDRALSRSSGRPVKTCRWMLGYRGMLHLARNTGLIKTIYSEVVFDDDEFEWHKGLHPDLTHRPLNVERSDPARLVAVYAVAHYMDGGHNFDVLTRPMVMARKARSNTGERGPWATDEIAMWRKTGFRALFPVLPTSSELLVRAVQSDEQVVNYDGVQREVFTEYDVEPVEAEEDES